MYHLCEGTSTISTKPVKQQAQVMNEKDFKDKCIEIYGEYAENTYRLEDKIHESKLGVKMRSKSEVLIANIFTDLGAPYLYEFPVYLGYYGTRFSDFLVLNVRLQKIFYCEHFGMMDNADYCAKSLEKIHAYEKSGYFPGSDLIIFHETSSKPLDTQLVRSIAEHYLL